MYHVNFMHAGEWRRREKKKEGWGRKREGGEREREAFYLDHGLTLDLNHFVEPL